MTQLLQRIVVGVDGSGSSWHAADMAIGLAKAHDSEVIFAYAVDKAFAGGPTGDSIVAALRSDADENLRRAKAMAVKARVAARSEVLEGRPEYALTQFAEEINASAIAVGTIGVRSVERYFLGSTTEGVLRLSSIPVFVGRDRAMAASGLSRRIVVPIDNSDPSDAAIAFATALANNDGSRLSFCHVIDEDTLYEEAASENGATYPVLHEWLDEAALLTRAASSQAKGLGVKSVETAVLTGKPVDEIMSFSAKEHADLIVMGAHGRRGLRHMLIGSVTHSIVRRSTVPVAVVRTRVTEPVEKLHPHIDSHGYVTLRADVHR